MLFMHCAFNLFTTFILRLLSYAADLVNVLKRQNNKSYTLFFTKWDLSTKKSVLMKVRVLLELAMFNF